MKTFSVSQTHFSLSDNQPTARALEFIYNVFNHMPNGITVQNEEGKILFANIQAARANGFLSVDEFIQAGNEDCLKQFEIRDEFGNPFPPNDLPGRKVIRGADASEAIICFRHLPEEKEYWSLVKATPYIDEKSKKRYAINSFQDITAHKNDDKEKDIQIGVVSHELKSLLTSVKAYGQILERKLIKMNELQPLQYLHKMDIQVNSLTRVITDLLSVTRIQSGRLELNKELFDLRELIDDVVPDVQIITRHRIMVKGVLSKKIFADKVRIREVLFNLLTNAMKYSPEENDIIIHLSAEKTQVICSVEDHGSGIPEDEKKKIFGLFYRGKTMDRNAKKGLGIGLFVAHGIIRAHGGNLALEKSSEEGTVMMFTLPHMPEDNKKEIQQ